MIGTVYKIEIGENIYIGSTIQPLKERQIKHNYERKRKNYKLYEECRKHNITKIICILLEEKEIEDIDEIRQLEQEYITKLQPSLNSQLAYTGLTHKEYNKQDYIKNREHYREKNKQYREKNKDEIREKKKQDWIKNREHYREKKKENYEMNKQKILEKKKENYEMNKQKILEKQRDDITCLICGFVSRKNKLLRHQRSKKCLKSKELVDKEAS